MQYGRYPSKHTEIIGLTLHVVGCIYFCSICPCKTLYNRTLRLTCYLTLYENLYNYIWAFCAVMLCMQVSILGSSWLTGCVDTMIWFLLFLGLLNPVCEIIACEQCVNYSMCIWLCTLCEGMLCVFLSVCVCVCMSKHVCVSMQACFLHVPPILTLHMG